MDTAATYENRATHSYPPAFRYAHCRHRSPWRTADAYTGIHAPQSVSGARGHGQTDTHIAIDMEVRGFLIHMWVDGSPGRTHDIEWFDLPIPWSQTATATTEEAEAELPDETERAVAGLPAQIEASIIELMNLPRGWDGYDGLPVQPDVAENARRFTARIERSTQLVPVVVPLSDGGLQLEWFVDGYEVEVVIVPSGTVYVDFECTGDGRYEEFTLDDPFKVEEIAPLFRELSS